MRAPNNSQAKFEQTLSILRNPDAAFTADAIYTLSDLGSEQMAAFTSLWSELSTERRHNLILRLVETAEANFDLDFGSIIEFALDDEAAEVRRAAIDGVLEDSSLRVVSKLVKLAQHDSSTEVRASAVGALGPFILQGELGKLPEQVNTQIQDIVLAIHTNRDEDPDVRRRALESISNCGREGVNELIRSAYYADALRMRLSAVFAMGRSCDDIWAPQILEELSSDYPEMRYEAARAAGELELQRALPRLVELAHEDDREVQEVAIWALGEIGGRTARNVLSKLAAIAEEAEDDELIDAIEEAQAAASLSGDELFPLLDFDDFDEDDGELVEIDEDEFDYDDDEDYEDLEDFEDEDDYAF